MVNKIDNFLSWFDLLEGESPLFWLLFGFMFLIIVEEVVQLSGFSKYFVGIAVGVAIIVRVLRSTFFSNNDTKNKQSTSKSKGKSRK